MAALDDRIFKRTETQTNFKRVQTVVFKATAREQNFKHAETQKLFKRGIRNGT